MNGNAIPCFNCGDILSGDEIYFVADSDNEYCGGCVEECGYCGEWFSDLDYHVYLVIHSGRNNYR